MFYVYVLNSIKYPKELYVGSTNNLKVRFRMHNDGKEISTKRYMPWKLIYYEAYSDEKLARNREQKLKHHGNAMKNLKKRILPSRVHPALSLASRDLSSKQDFSVKIDPKNKRPLHSAGFTFIEAILYIGLVTIMMSYIVPYAWNVIQGGKKSANQEEVTSNARFISERIKYEIRNSFGINSVSATQIVLCTNIGSCATNPTTITYTLPNVIIQDNGGAAVNLNSNNVRVTSLEFFNRSSVDNKTKNISFTMTVTTNYQGSRKEYIYTVNLQSAAEVRSN